jgi:hypothetical protein
MNHQQHPCEYLIPKIIIFLSIVAYVYEGIQQKLHSIYTSFLQYSSSVPGMLPSEAIRWGLPKIIFSGKWGVLQVVMSR